jgi:uncharacterized protein (TIGR02266 family)
MNSGFDEKRQNSRASIRTEITCDEIDGVEKQGSGVLSFSSSDISLGGIFLETSLPFAAGNKVRLSFRLPNQVKALTVTGRVVRTTFDIPSLRPGIGIQFEEMDPENKKIIEGFVIDEIAHKL